MRYFLIFFIGIFFNSSAQQIEWLKMIHGSVAVAHYYEEDERIYISGVAAGSHVDIGTQSFSWSGYNISYIARIDKNGYADDAFCLQSDFISNGFFKGENGFYSFGSAVGGNSFCMRGNQLNGNASWAFCYESTPPYWVHSTYYPTNMALDEIRYNNSLYAVGIYEDSLQMDGQWLYGSNSLLAKWNPADGSLFWMKNIPGQNLYSKMRLIDLKNGSFLIGSDIYQNGNYLFDSLSLTVTNGITILSRTDTFGNFTWIKPVSERTTMRGMSIDTSKNIFIAGNFRDSCKIGTAPYLGEQGGMFILKSDSLGVVLWSKTIHSRTGCWEQQMNSLTLDDDGNLFVTGSFSSDSLNLGDTILTRNSGIDAFLAKYSPAGQLLYAMNLSSSTGSYGFDVTTDDDKSVYWSGRFYDQIMIGDSILYGNAINEDPTYFIIKISRPGLSLSAHESSANKEMALGVYPNPANNSLTVSVNSVGPSADYLFSVQSMTGQTLFNLPLKNITGEYTKQIDLSFLPKGIYLLGLAPEGISGHKESGKFKKVVIQ